MTAKGIGILFAKFDEVISSILENGTFVSPLKRDPITVVLLLISTSEYRQWNGRLKHLLWRGEHYCHEILTV